MKKYFLDSEIQKIIAEENYKRKKVSILGIIKKTFEETFKDQLNTEKDIELLENEINFRLRSNTGIDLNVKLERVKYSEIVIKDIFIRF
ncbi:hypothetical protein Amet_2587 [Alkaliphilus metalliredigens QYMF]|uniref:Uncharacterized protein n=1 Tax=Alkaliphilus metalliredigens (strain QYMF) TaxID=293826 RepID=A6TRC1_ALKMQ|nr:hypothetical protein [Alkaliphilus metalliredigens]ABR48739.1 hypothetical protein Amet_2587 [Alkaliphilus metalliredigens QYMF]